MTTPATRPALSMKPEGDSDFKPLKSGLYRATFLSYTLREHAADPNGKFEHEKAGYMDFECKWKIQIPAGGTMERRTFPRITPSASEKSNLVQLWVALGVIELETVRKAGVGDVYHLMDRCIGRDCLWVMEATVRQDGKPGDKIKAMTPYIAAVFGQSTEAPPAANGADPRFYDDESEIPF